MDLQYSYFLLDIIFLFIWVILFYFRKDLRKQMFVFSIAMGIVGLALNIIYIKDWWTPLTITNTIPSLEDFLYGFGLGGIAYASFLTIFARKLSKSQKRPFTELILKSLLCLILFYLLYFILKLNTFITSITLLLIITVIILIKRKDLILQSLISGIILTIITIIAYFLVSLATPTWINEFWYFNFLPKQIILNMPLEDIIFYFLFGTAFGIFSPYWQKANLIKLK